GREIAHTPGVAAATSVRSDMARVLGADTPVVGVDPATIAGLYGFEFTGGSDAAVRGLAGGALVDKSYASKHQLKVGSPLRGESPNGTTVSLTVRGIYKVQVEQLLGGVVIPQATFDRAF